MLNMSREMIWSSIRRVWRDFMLTNMAKKSSMMIIGFAIIGINSQLAIVSNLKFLN